MPPVTVYTFSPWLSLLKHIASCLNADELKWCPPYAGFMIRPGPKDFIVGWGNKNLALHAQKAAASKGIPFLQLEDGFIRSVDLGVNGAEPLSIIVDDIGLYYDATRASRLEQILNGTCREIPDIPALAPLKQLTAPHEQDPLEDPQLLKRARQCIEQIVTHKLSKYNRSPEFDLGEKTTERILIIDQTAGDLSISYGMASADSFRHMLDSAIEEHPEAEIYIKTHPDVLAGKKAGLLTQLPNSKNTKLIGDDINPISLIEQVDKVYVVTSQLGFEALMLGKSVVCFGAPFYSGWGLTEDRIKIDRRNKKRSLEQVFAAAYLIYSRYIHPLNKRPTTLETIIEHMALQRHWFNRNHGDLHCVGFNLSERSYIRRFLQCPWGSISFQSQRSLAKQFRDDVGPDDRIVVKASNDNEKLIPLSDQHGIPVWQLDEGFLQSLMPDMDVAAPVSMVVDTQGIYFDARQPSELESVLQNKAFSEAEIDRAKRLIEMLTTSAISQTNTGAQFTVEHQARPGQKIILVPGQMETDASLQLGTMDIRTNEALLKAVRDRNPDAYMMYKPHPNELRGKRNNIGAAPSGAEYDLLVEPAAVSECLEHADEVHTMTSLTGFEALLRGKSVSTYGQPFYAGWGLTDDIHPLLRRERKLTLPELVAGCLILYPRYVDHNNKCFITPEAAIEMLNTSISKKNATV